MFIRKTLADWQERSSRFYSALTGLNTSLIKSMTAPTFDRQLWETRLNESLALLDQIIGSPCECEPEWNESVMFDTGSIIPKMCIQCYARNTQMFIGQIGSHVSDAVLQDAVRQVISRIDDTGMVTISPEHELECIRYWAQVD